MGPVDLEHQAEFAAEDVLPATWVRRDLSILEDRSCPPALASNDCGTHPIRRVPQDLQRLRVIPPESFSWPGGPARKSLAWGV